jgi:hypothetical protein
VDEISQVCVDLLSVSYVLKRYNCHFVFTTSARGGYAAPVRATIQDAVTKQMRQENNRAGGPAFEFDEAGDFEVFALT